MKEMFAFFPHQGPSRKGGALIAAVVSALLVLGAACRTEPGFEYDFEDEENLDQLEWKCRTLYRISPDHATSGAKSLEISCYPSLEGATENYPGVSFSKFNPDWSKHRALVFDIYNPEKSAIQLAVRIDDQEAPDYTERFNQALTLGAGGNRVSIPLADLVTSGTRRPLDRRRIRTIVLFLSNPRERHTLYLDRVRLE